MQRLLEIGFQEVGRWRLSEGRLEVEIDHYRGQRNVVYAFVCDDEIKYIGKTVQTLGTRMSGYQYPARGQRTNERNHAAIKELLGRGRRVSILGLADNGLLRYGRFHLNLAAGLEDSLIAEIDPHWNGGRRSTPLEDVMDNVIAPAVADAHTFELTVQETYYKNGFFNVYQPYGNKFGADGEAIDIYLDEATEPVLGTINRTANRNGGPRIMGRRQLREWFQQRPGNGELVTVEVLSPTSIRMRRQA